MLTLANWNVMAMINSMLRVMDSTNKVYQIIFWYVEATQRKLYRRFNTSTILFLATEYNAQDGGTCSNGSDFRCCRSPIANIALIVFNIYLQLNIHQSAELDLPSWE